MNATPIIVFLTLFMLTGCATIVSKSKYTINVKANEPGAETTGLRLAFRRISQREPELVIPRRQTENDEATPSLPQHAAYKIISCERDSRDAFSYSFVLELKDDDNSLRTFRDIQQEFRSVLREDYVESTPGMENQKQYVDFPEYSLENSKIIGRATILSITPVQMKYDPNTRTGRLAVKVNANQYEEARKWIRKNIETLARDKNIALVTGEIPPAAKFYLGKEELKDGNVLEIEFKTE